MCRLYVAVNDEKGNKIRRSGHNSRDKVDEMFVYSIFYHQRRKKYGYTVEVKKRKSKKVYKSYTIKEEITEDILNHIIDWEIGNGKHCIKINTWNICNNDCLICSVDYKRSRAKHLELAFKGVE